MTKGVLYAKTRIFITKSTTSRIQSHSGNAKIKSVKVSISCPVLVVGIVIDFALRHKKCLKTVQLLEITERNRT